MGHSSAETLHSRPPSPSPRPDLPERGNPRPRLPCHRPTPTTGALGRRPPTTVASSTTALAGLRGSSLHLDHTGDSSSSPDCHEWGGPSSCAHHLPSRLTCPDLHTHRGATQSSNRGPDLAPFESSNAPHKVPAVTSTLTASTLLLCTADISSYHPSCGYTTLTIRFPIL